MSKTKLEIDYDYEFCLIGIVCNDKDYRLCWKLNPLLNLRLAKSDDHKVEHFRHSLFTYTNNDLFKEYYLFSNKGENSDKRGEFRNLIEEHKNIDYFLIIKGQLDEEEKKNVLELIKKQENVSAAYLIEAISLKSKQNLLL